MFHRRIYKGNIYQAQKGTPGNIICILEDHRFSFRIVEYSEIVIYVEGNLALDLRNDKDAESLFRRKRGNRCKPSGRGGKRRTLPAQPLHLVES